MKTEDLTAEFRKILECGICLNVVRNPKQLSCDHSFCQTCLDKILEFAPNGSAIIKCPNGCEAKTRLSATRTTNDLHNNFMLKSASELMADKGVHKIDPKKGKCSSCSRSSVKYCTKCDKFKCAECVDIHDGTDAENFKDFFIPVSFSTNNEQTGVFYCQEHKTAAEYACCHTQEFVCIYCINRGAHKTHKYEPLSQVEEMIRTQVQKKVDENVDFEERWRGSVEEIKMAKEYLEKELNVKEIRCLLDYFEYLSKEKQKILDEFQQVSNSYKLAFANIKHFKDAMTGDRFEFLLHKRNLIKQMNTIFMESTSKCIPGIEVYLDSNTFGGANPLGTLKTDYRCGNSYKTFKGRFSTEKVEDLDALALNLGDLRTFVDSFRKKKDSETDAQHDENNNAAKYINDENGIRSDEPVEDEKAKVSSAGVDEIQDKAQISDGSDDSDDEEAETSDCSEVSNEVPDDEVENKKKAHVPNCSKVLEEASDDQNDGQCITKLALAFPVQTINSTIDCLFKVCNMKRLQDEWVFSEPVMMRDFIFKLKTFVIAETDCLLNERRQYVSLYLFCCYNGNDAEWSLPCEITLNFKKAVGESFSRSYSITFDKTQGNRGFRKFVEWDELLDPEQGFLVNDALTVQAVITSPLLTE